MSWMKERDSLIAQTMAFVQSVTGRREDPRPDLKPVLPPVEVDIRAELAAARREVARLPADFLQHRPQVFQERIRILAHREVAEPLHDRDLAAQNATCDRQRLLRSAGIIVFA